MLTVCYTITGDGACCLIMLESHTLQRIPHWISAYLLQAVRCMSEGSWYPEIREFVFTLMPWICSFLHT